MEEMAERKMEGGKNSVSTLFSQATPFESSILPEDEPLTTLIKLRRPKAILILPQNIAFAGITDLSLREYYFTFRKRINFVRIEQVILFENVRENISIFFDFPYSGLYDFNRSANGQHENLESLKQLIAIPRIDYGVSTTIVDSDYTHFDNRSMSLSFVHIASAPQLRVQLRVKVGAGA
jgi:hypothetical protein